MLVFGLLRRKCSIYLIAFIPNIFSCVLKAFLSAAFPSPGFIQGVGGLVRNYVCLSKHVGSYI